MEMRGEIFRREGGRDRWREGRRRALRKEGGKEGESEGRR